MVNSEIDHCEVDVSHWSTENLHLVAVELLNQPVKYIFNVYVCKCTMKEADWMFLDKIQKSLTCEIVFCRDFNAGGEG